MQRIHSLRAWACLAALTLVLPWLVGCSSNANLVSAPTATGGSGSLHFSVQWPAGTRVIPDATAKITVTLEGLGLAENQRSFEFLRPANGYPTTVTQKVADLPVTDIKITAKALDNTGFKLAQIVRTVRIVNDQEVNADLNMAPVTVQSVVTVTSTTEVIPANQQVDVNALVEYTDGETKRPAPANTPVTFMVTSGQGKLNGQPVGTPVTVNTDATGTAVVKAESTQRGVNLVVTASATVNITGAPASASGSCTLQIQQAGDFDVVVQ
jgi:hypothetical protein